MYTAFILLYLARFLVSANWVIGITWLGISALSVARVGEEEALMVEEFGDEYRVYMERTGRFLPRLRSSEKESSTSQHRVMTVPN